MTDYGNLQKHQNPNKIQQMLIERFHRRIAGLTRRTARNCLLDSGCGEGFVLDYLRESGVSARFVGSDLRPEALQWARANLVEELDGVAADIHHLPFADNTFPLVLCLEVLEHIPDSTAGLHELARVSSEYLILSVPHEPYFRGANFLRGKHLSHFGNDRNTFTTTAAVLFSVW